MKRIYLKGGDRDMRASIPDDIIFQKIRVKPKIKIQKRDDWKRLRKAMRIRKVVTQEHHMKTYGR